MRYWLFTGALGVLLTLPLAAQQQDSSAPRAQSSQSASQKKKNDPQPEKGKAQQPAAQANPFPMEQSQKAAQQGQAQQGQAQKDQGNSAADQNSDQNSGPKPNQKQNQAPDQPQPHTGSSAADQNPFPEEQSEKAAHEAQQQSTPAAKAGQPASQEGSSSQVKGLELGEPGGASYGAGGTVLSPELARKDAKIGDFYLHTGDYKGAYNRFAEAARVDPGNAEAVFGLAEAARHLDRRAEAISNYQLYISAVPDGPHARDARKALKELGAGPRS
jgi:tetratricopeptide (TPR) repeat protein